MKKIILFFIFLMGVAPCFGMEKKKERNCFGLEHAKAEKILERFYFWITLKRAYERTYELNWYNKKIYNKKAYNVRNRLWKNLATTAIIYGFQKCILINRNF